MFNFNIKKNPDVQSFTPIPSLKNLPLPSAPAYIKPPNYEEF